MQFLSFKDVDRVAIGAQLQMLTSQQPDDDTSKHEQEEQNRSTGGCSKLKRSVDMTSSG